MGAKVVEKIELRIYAVLFHIQFHDFHPVDGFIFRAKITDTMPTARLGRRPILMH
jgi:hypothetical protein